MTLPKLWRMQFWLLVKFSYTWSTSTLKIGIFFMCASDYKFAYTVRL